MKKGLLGVFVFCCGLLSCNDNNHIANYRVVPLPQEVTPIEAEEFSLNGRTVISYDGNQELKKHAAT